MRKEGLQKIGGRGHCRYCHQWVDNAAYHEARECSKRPKNPDFLVLCPQCRRKSTVGEIVEAYNECPGCKNPFTPEELKDNGFGSEDDVENDD